MTELESLVGSGKAWFNQPDEVNLRFQEQEAGLSKPERRIIRLLPQQSRILDIGCATGRASIALAQAGHLVTGIDVAEQLVKKARTFTEKHKLAITYQVCDPLTLPFPEGVFDAALLLKTYCYVPKRQKRIAWLTEIARVLKPEGWLCLSQYIIDYAELINRRPKPDRETEVIFDEERDHYLLVTVGWSEQRRVRGTTVYVRLRNGKFWIEEDWLENGIATDLLRADVPKEDIVLAFHPPEMRSLTEFAVA